MFCQTKQNLHRYVFKCLISFFIRKMQIKIVLTLYLTAVRMAITSRLNDHNSWHGCGVREYIFTCTVIMKNRRNVLENIARDRSSIRTSCTICGGLNEKNPYRLDQSYGLVVGVGFKVSKAQLRASIPASCRSRSRTLSYFSNTMSASA